MKLVFLIFLLTSTAFGQEHFCQDGEWQCSPESGSDQIPSTWGKHGPMMECKNLKTGKQSMGIFSKNNKVSKVIFSLPAYNLLEKDEKLTAITKTFEKPKRFEELRTIEDLRKLSEIPSFESETIKFDPFSPLRILDTKILGRTLPWSFCMKEPLIKHSEEYDFTVTRCIERGYSVDLNSTQYPLGCSCQKEKIDFFEYRFKKSRSDYEKMSAWEQSEFSRNKSMPQDEFDTGMNSVLTPCKSSNLSDDKITSIND